MTRQTDTSPILLLPPSKGKAGAGDGPTYERVLRKRHPLAQPRRALAAAVAADLAGLDDVRLARVAGVGRQDVDAARRELTELSTTPTLPAHRRYTGIVHGNADLASVDPAQLEIEVLIVSALAGLVRLDEPLPAYRLEFGASLPSIGGIGTWWRAQIADHLRSLVDGRRVWDLLPAEHARVWDRQVRSQALVSEVSFVRPDGAAANAARAKVCKGRVAAFLLANPNASPSDVAEAADAGPGWKLTVAGEDVTATYTG